MAKRINNFTQGYVSAIVNFINYRGYADAVDKRCFEALEKHTELSLQNAGVEKSDIDILKQHELLAN